jgi:hypothetical protein
MMNPRGRQEGQENIPPPNISLIENLEDIPFFLDIKLINVVEVTWDFHEVTEISCPIPFRFGIIY